MRAVQEVLLNQGSGFTMLIVFGVAVLILVLLGKLLKNSKIVTKLKNKLMWSSIFRSVIQTYLPACLMVFGLILNSI